MSTRTDAKTIYEILEEVRKDKGLSQRQACAELKTTTTTWRNWGRGQTPGWDWEKRFIKFTGLPRDEIVDAIAEHARRHPEVVFPLSLDLGRRAVSTLCKPNPTVRAHVATDRDYRPIDIYADMPDAA